MEENKVETIESVASETTNEEYGQDESGSTDLAVVNESGSGVGTAVKIIGAAAGLTALVIVGIKKWRKKKSQPNPEPEVNEQQVEVVTDFQEVPSDQVEVINPTEEKNEETKRSSNDKKKR